MSQTTPMSSYSGPVVVDPLTRIEGHLRIEVEVEKGKVKDVRSCGTLFRGLEMILKGRDPRDVQHFTQRTCGVCTYTHALASTRALEDAINKPIPANATYLRNLVLGMQFLHDHLVHFYALHALDFVDVTGAFQVVQICISALLGIFGVAAALNGFLYRPIPALLRVAMAVGGLGMMIPGTATDIAGFVLVVGIVLYQRFSARRAAMV